jgi:hypothetical protein
MRVLGLRGMMMMPVGRQEAMKRRYVSAVTVNLLLVM